VIDILVVIIPKDQLFANHAMSIMKKKAGYIPVLMIM
jgi:hypothetical protein